MSDTDFGRKLTKDEVIKCVAATGDDQCAACGAKWVDHHVRCEGSYVSQKPPETYSKTV